MSLRPVSPRVLLGELVELLGEFRAGQWVRVAVDGAPPARPAELADALVDPLRTLGRAVLRVRAEDFLRPASLRFEHGRTDPDAFYTDRLDAAGLAREVLRPLEPGGSGRVLPALWDAERDRATRASYVDLPAGGVLLLDGGLLLGRGLPIDFAVHLWLSPAALARQIDEEQRWTLPAYARYAEEVAPAELADVAVRVDNAAHPALSRSPSG
ncbi:MAG TPA: uridine kinase [Pseudonocardiaceae bacterium]|nr:uridine kinase [Pseudonocardiaceae bacterium]